MADYERARRRMVDRQLRGRGVEDERVLAAMATVPRERFVPAEDRSRAYRDGALRIGAGQTISQPWIVATMASLLELHGDERVLEVGTGSGYSAAVLSMLCAELVTIERHPELAASARAVLGDLGHRNVEVRNGDGSQGALDRAPFKGIAVTATARERPPAALTEQLAGGGILVCPVDAGGSEMLVRFQDSEQRAVAPVRFVPLVEADDDPGRSESDADAASP